MDVLSFSNPVFAAYVLAASVMILKVVAMSWLTVYRMIRVNAGFRSPEDAKKTPLNKSPKDGQVGPNDYVDRIRRIQGNDLENVPFFLVAGFLFVFTQPQVTTAQVLYYTYAVTRILHFFAYATAQTHDLRATLWTPGSLIIIYMALRSGAAALGL